jgi:hypothetical protein
MAILKPGQLASGSYTISGSFSGSFQGSGAGLNNIPSSAIVGLSSSLDIGTTPIVSGTIGRVLFQGTGNVLQQSANLFWDNTNNRLGIGTSSPLSPLHIVGSSLGTGLIVNTGYAHLGTQTNPINTTLWNAALHISYTTDAALLFRTGPTFNLSTGIGQTTTGNLYIGWRNAGNPPINVFYSTGNVGINTTTDAGFRLDVNGTARFTSTVRIQDTLQMAFGSVIFEQGGGNYMLEGQALRFGNGIGLRFYSGATNTGSPDAGFYRSSAGTLRISNGSTGLGTIESLKTLIGTTTDTGHTLTVSGSGVSGSVNLDNTLYVSGSRVGIGTSSPATGLDARSGFNLWVGGGHYLEPVVVSGTDVSIRLRRTADNGWVRYALGANSFAQFGANANTGEVQLFNSVSCFQTFYSNGVERMRIPTTGNILINTTTDSGFRLDVNGTARVSQTLRVNGTGNLTLIDLGGNGSIFQHSTGYIFKSASSANMLTVLNNFVGVNSITDIPSAVLAADSTTRGFLPPRMTGAQAELISSPAEGLMVYATNGTGVTITSKGWWGYDGATWVKFN